MNCIVSIIVPIYNVELYIHKCLDSIINQSYKNLEIILVDDESPDNCGKICDDYAKKDKRIKVIHQKNMGLSGARNSGVKVATGDFISFVDSDDWIENDMYSAMIALAIKHKLNIVECDIIERKTDTSVVNEQNISKTDFIIENCIDTYKRIIKNTQFSVWRRIYKAELIKDYEFLLNKTSEDIYFTIDNICKVDKVGLICYPFYNYRANPNSITKSSYSLKRLNDSISGSLYLQKKMKSIYNDDELLIIINEHMLSKFLLHYKRINYNSHLDKTYSVRKKIKSLLEQNYFKSNNHSIYLRLAKHLPIKAFKLLIKCNILKHKLLKTNQFS